MDFFLVRKLSRKDAAVRRAELVCDRTYSSITQLLNWLKREEFEHFVCFIGRIVDCFVQFVRKRWYGVRLQAGLVFQLSEDRSEDWKTNKTFCSVRTWLFATRLVLQSLGRDPDVICRLRSRLGLDLVWELIGRF